jgi:hypothetical protein
MAIHAHVNGASFDLSIGRSVSHPLVESSRGIWYLPLCSADHGIWYLPLCPVDVMTYEFIANGRPEFYRRNLHPSCECKIWQYNFSIRRVYADTSTVLTSRRNPLFWYDHGAFPRNDDAVTRRLVLAKTNHT